MNISGGLALVRKSLLSFTASRGFFWTLALGWMMGPLVYLFVWMMAAGSGRIGGFDRGDFVLYYLLLMVINQLTYPASHWTVGENIQLGTLSTWLLRPLPVIYEAIAGDVAMKIVCVPFVVILVVVLGCVLGVQCSLTVSTFAVFLVVLLLAQVLRFMLAYVLSLMAFWTQRISSLLSINDTCVFLLAGQVAPMALLPGVVKQLAIVLPYRYMLGFPIEVLMGKLTPNELLTGLCIQIGWVGAVLLLHRVIWKRGVQHYTAVGG